MVGGAPRRTLEVHIASPARSPSHDLMPRAGMVEVGDQRTILIHNHGPHRHIEGQIRAAATRLATAGAVASRLRLPAHPSHVRSQVEQVGGCPHPHRAAASAISAVGAAAWDKRLVPK